MRSKAKQKMLGVAVLYLNYNQEVKARWEQDIPSYIEGRRKLAALFEGEARTQERVITSFRR
jgi:hypothetical protein